MHPILFRIPLPHRPLMLWWLLAAVVVLAIGYAIAALRRGDRENATLSGAVAIASGLGMWLGRAVSFEAANLPIYSYGVMLGLSLVVGWYLTLTLAERDGLPKETMANCYIVTALAAIAGARLLYVVTNLDEFKTASDILAFRRGGLVAYGGFLGGFVGSLVFLRANRIRLLPWADVAVPSLGSGLMITRIGCYLFGCDFGKPLSDKAPGFLQRLGTFPHWQGGTLDGGDGSPAFIHHMEIFRGTPKGAAILESHHSLPVHPTQIYESLVGLALLVLLLTQRKHKIFRGQMFYTFVYAYGVARFLIEMLRDDTERGEYGPVMAEHFMIPLCLFLFAAAFSYGIALGVRNGQARTIARVAAFLPAIVSFLVLRPSSFGQTVNLQLSTSQIIALVTALLAAYFYASAWQDARRDPRGAMTLGLDGELETERARREAEEEKDEDEKEDEEPESERKPTGEPAPEGA